MNLSIEWTCCNGYNIYHLCIPQSIAQANTPTQTKTLTDTNNLEYVRETKCSMGILWCKCHAQQGLEWPHYIKKYKTWIITLSITSNSWLQDHNEYKKKDKKCLYGHNNHSQTIDSAITRVVIVNDEEKHWSGTSWGRRKILMLWELLWLVEDFFTKRERDDGDYDVDVDVDEEKTAFSCSRMQIKVFCWRW